MRALGRAAALVAAGALAAGVCAAPAAADTAGSSYSAAAQVTPSGTIAPQIEPDGLVGWLLAPVTDVANQLVAAVGALPTQLLSGLADTLTGAGLHAQNPDASLPAPQSGYPSCTSGGWSATDCYGPVLPSTSLPPLLSLSTGVVRGFATGDQSGYTAKAIVSNPELDLLGVDIGKLGIIESSSHCPASGQCTATRTMTGASLLGDLITANLASSDGLLSLSVAGTPVASGTCVVVAAAAQDGCISVSGVLPAGLQGVRVSLDENLATIRLGLRVSDLLDGLGLGGLLSSVAGLVALPDSWVTLTLTIGPGDAPARTSTEAWGLELGVDLAAGIKLGVPLLGGVTVEVPSGISGSSYGNLLDAKLAYTNATSGALPGSGPEWIPPGLI